MTTTTAPPTPRCEATFWSATGAGFRQRRCKQQRGLRYAEGADGRRHAYCPTPHHQARVESQAARGWVPA